MATLKTLKDNTLPDRARRGVFLERVFQAMAAIILASLMLTSSAASDDSPAPAASAWDYDLRQDCDLNDNAPISAACRAYMTGIVQLNLGDYASRLGGGRKGSLLRSCLTVSNIDEIVRAIRPALRNRVGKCRGLCNAAGYVQAALNEVYPCR